MSGPAPHPYNPILIEAAIALNENRLDVAERLLKPHLKEDPFDAAAIRMLAELAARIGRMQRRRKPSSARGGAGARMDGAESEPCARSSAGPAGPAEALALLDDVFAAEPDDIGHRNLKAATLGRLGDFDEAITIYEGVLEQAPEQPRLWLSYGHMLKTVGRQAEGIAAYRKAIALPGGARRGVVEPRQSQDRQVRRKRYCRDGESAFGSPVSRMKIGSTSISRLARQCTMREEPTRPFVHYSRRKCAQAEIAALPRRRHQPRRRPQHRSLLRRKHWPSGSAAAKRRIRSSSSECRAPDRLSSSRSFPRTAWSKEHRSSRTSQSSRASRACIRMPSLSMDEVATPRTRRAISEARRGPAPNREAILHRQASEQLALRALHPADPAQCEDHRCQAPSTRLLPFQLPAAFRSRPGVHLRPRRTLAHIMPTTSG